MSFQFPSFVPRKGALMMQEDSRILVWDSVTIWILVWDSVQPMFGLSRCLLVQDETDLTKTLNQGWQALSQGGEEKASEALRIFTEAIKLDPTDPRAHNYCGIANEILGKESDSEQNYAKADRYCGEKHAGNDYDKSLRALQNLRKWKPIKFCNRGDAEGKPKPTGTDFLISFQTEDSDFNNRALKKLSDSDIYFQEKKGH